MEDVFIKVIGTSGCNVQKNGIVVSGVSALRNPDFVRDIMCLGLITMHSTAPNIIDRIDIMDGTPLMAVLLDYAVEVAPRVEGQDAVIDADSLHSHVEYMRKMFGAPVIPEDFIIQIGRAAQVQIEITKLEKPATPEGSS